MTSIFKYLRPYINIYRENKRAKRLIHRVNDRLGKLPYSQSNLTEDEIKAINKYYQGYGLKLRSFSFHNFYKRVTKTFDVRFLPEDIYYYKIDQYLNNWLMARFIDNKTLYPILFRDVKQPEMVCYRQNGYWFNGEGEPIFIADVEKELFRHKYVFVKVAQESYGGHGVKYIKSNLALDYIKNITKDIVIQIPLEQSPILSSLNPSSVNTIRIMTFLRKDSTVKVCSMILRMGIGDSKVDNASSGGITVGIQQDGKLNKIAFSVTGVSYTLHPTSNIRFEDIKIPNISSIKELVTDQAPHFPYFRLISWDIALDKDNNPILIEANLCDGELDFHQLNNGPLFGDETEQILNEIFI